LAERVGFEKREQLIGDFETPFVFGCVKSFSKSPQAHVHPSERGLNPSVQM